MFIVDFTDAKMTPEEIVNEPFSSYKLMSSVRNICLPPRYLGNITQGIRDQLDSEINLYCSDLESVVINYENLKLLQAVGSILDDSPFLHFRIQADYLVFKPTIGCLLKGVVNKVSKDHIGCLVHNRFNASIHRPRQNLNGWRGSQLQQGEEFPFEVLDIYSNNAVISLKGKLVEQKIIEAYLKSLSHEGGSQKSGGDAPADNVIVSGGGEITLEGDPVRNKKRKRKFSTSELGDGSQDITDGDIQPSKPKKKKKDVEVNEEESYVKKPKKKKKSLDESDCVRLSPIHARKRKDSVGENSLTGSDLSQKSAKKVRFESTTSDSVPDRVRMEKKKVNKFEPDDGSDLDNSLTLDSSVLDNSISQQTEKKKKKKKKHKKEGQDLPDEELYMTQIKDKADLDVCKREKKKKKRDRKEKLSVECGQNLMDVVLALQSEVTKTASKLNTPSPTSSKKKKQKKKKHRESSSSPERVVSPGISKKKSKRKSTGFISDSLDVESVNESLLQEHSKDTNVIETGHGDVSFSDLSSRKKRHSENDSDQMEETTRKQKKKKHKKEKD